MKVHTTYFGAVRRNTETGREFVAPGELSGHPDFTTVFVKQSAKDMSRWHKDNPVVRISSFRIEEDREVSDNEEF
jgi:hypothetical protein